MSTERKVLIASLAAVSAVVLLLIVVPWAREELEPVPVAAHVAIAAGPPGTRAVDAPVRLAAAGECTLFAVLEARRRDGSPVYYTEAPVLELAGEEIPAEALLRWRGAREVRVMWFTVEGTRPFVEAEEPAAVERFAFATAFRADWPRAWAVPCDLEPSSEGFAGGFEGLEVQEFGTQRYLVRLEIFGPASSIRPEERFSSAGPEAVLARPDAYPTVTAVLPGALAVPSSFFGLTQFRLAPGLPQPVAARLAEWSRQRLAFTRTTVTRETLEAAGRSWEELGWTSVELAAGPPWGDGGVEPGDLVRVGERVVVLYRDRGIVGRLDYDDLCFDYEKGAGLRPLKAVFTGDGLVEWASLGADGGPA